MKLRDKSYMDTQSYLDIKIDFDTLNIDQLYEDLLNFYIKHEKTKKWHKKDYYEEIPFLDKKEETMERLKKYYVNCFSELDRVKIKRLNDVEENQLNEEEQLLYLKELRMIDDIKLNNTSIKKQLILNPILQKLMSLSRIASRIKVIAINKKLPEGIENRPIIFTLSHVSKEDQIIFNEAVTKHYTILSGDYENLHNNIEGTITKLNGVIFFDMNSKEERQNVVSRVSEKLKSGDNILCSMEGAWNLSANTIVNPLFTGMISAALDSKAVIVPVAIERFNSNLYSICVSDKFYDPIQFFSNKEVNKENMKSFAEEIRQKLADMKFNSYFNSYIYPKIQTKREELESYEEENKKFKEDILTGWNFDEEDIKRKGYFDKEKPINVYDYVITRFENKKNMISNMSTDEYTKYISELRMEINNPIYPNEIHEKLVSILESLEENIKRR